MLTKRTVLVVGAGASFDAGMPLGQELKADIAASLGRSRTSDGWKLPDSAHDICEVFRYHPNELELRAALAAGATIAAGINFVSSIDNYLEVRGQDKAINLTAKAAIARILIDNERRSHLLKRESGWADELNVANINNTWYPEIAQIVFEGITATNLPDAFVKLTTISFNYDRCIEFFLFNSARAAQADAAKLISLVKIIHPYGSLGPLPELSPQGGIAFGAELAAHDMLPVLQQIRTYTEAVDQDIVAQARDAMRQAEMAVILGFAFHPQNMDLLDPGERLECQFIGTAKGMSPNDIRLVRARLKSWQVRDAAEHEIALEAATCTELLRQYKRTIAGRIPNAT